MSTTLVPSMAVLWKVRSIASWMPALGDSFPRSGEEWDVDSPTPSKVVC